MTVIYISGSGSTSGLLVYEDFLNSTDCTYEVKSIQNVIVEEIIELLPTKIDLDYAVFDDEIYLALQENTFKSQWVLRDKPYLMPIQKEIKVPQRFNRKSIRCDRKGIGLRIKSNK